MTATELFDKIIEQLNKRLKESDDYTSYDQAQDYAIKVADTTSQLVIDNISHIAKNEQYNTLDYNYCNELLLFVKLRELDIVTLT